MRCLWAPQAGDGVMCSLGRGARLAGGRLCRGLSMNVGWVFLSGWVRLRQAVIAVRDLGDAAERLCRALTLAEPFSDPGVGYFGLRNAVFALGDTFLEVVSPVQDDTAAGRLLERRGGDCGYMLMFQVEDLAAARERARAEGIREVFEVSREDMSEVHLHPAGMRGAIVSLSRPEPPESWRWGGAGGPDRGARGR